MNRQRQFSVFALALLLSAALQIASAQEEDISLEAVGETSAASGGTPGHIYNLASDAGQFQISTLVKEANNAKHIGQAKNGTYMQAVAFGTKEATVVIETFADDSARAVVKINDEELLMDASGSASKTLVLADGTKLTVTWSLFMEPYGTTVNITSDAVALMVYLVPPGLDHHDLWQPSYLNINLTLLSQPKNDLQGVIGDTYHYKKRESASTQDSNLFNAPVAAFVNDVYPIYPDFTYEIPSFFAAPRYSFTHRFTHHLIQMRKDSAAKKAALSLPSAAA